MTDPDRPRVPQDQRASGDADVVLFLVLRSSMADVDRVLGLRKDASVVELSPLDPGQTAPESTVEILAPRGSTLTVDALLREGEIRILKGASLLQEQSRLLREAVAARG
ncbi:MAG: hypothetical protein ACP5HZ_02595 [Ferrimicrobium sp.]|uniref:hypothetical protein n=1 Tax=Ferrimicrobium sp. TaxID=2926050 RepID=UPI0026300E07|nr:hypothetical protein [Ferrimicrobium sp.]